MKDVNKKPIVYLASVNSFHNGKRIKYLLKERNTIKKIITSRQSDSQLEVVAKDKSSQAYFFDFIHKNYGFDRIKVLHFIGEADNEHLRVESGKAEASIHINELSKFIALLPHLELVFLHGCATPRLMDMLVRRDVPVIIACESRNKDKRAAQIARSFYTDISEGASLQDALFNIQQLFPNFGSFQVSYNFEEDEFSWPFDSEKLVPGKLPWGLYYLKDHESHLHKSLLTDKTEAQQGRVSQRLLKTAESKKLRQNILTASAAAAAMLACVGLSIYLGGVDVAELRALLSF